VPAAREGAALAYDDANRTLVMFGGYGSNNAPLGDSWSWDGNHWSQLSPPTSPPPRSFGALAPDGLGNLILFGGGAANADSPQGDTWKWTDCSWTQLHPASSPRAWSALSSWDPRSRQLLLIQFSPDHSVTTWLWSGSTWSQLQPAHSPPWREDAGMAYDPARGRVLVFGGFPQLGLTLTDTWAWTGADWMQLQPAHHPSEGIGNLGTTRDGLVWHEGDRQTWLWNGSDWTKASPASEADPFDFQRLAYDAASSQTVAVGGHSGFSGDIVWECWIWNGTTWARQS